MLDHSDSIMAPFRADFVGRGELAERQQRLSSIMRKLRKMADEFNVSETHGCAPASCRFATRLQHKLTSVHALKLQRAVQKFANRKFSQN